MASSSIKEEEFDDCPEDGSFTATYNSLPEKHPTTIRFFDQNDYYKVYGNDAHFIAKELFKTSTVIKTIRSGNQKLDYVNVSKMNFESFIRELLLVRAYRVEIYKNSSSGKAREWKCICKASPGNFGKLEEFLFGTSDATEAKGIIAIKIKMDAKQLNVGVGYGDSVLRQFLVAEFVDDHNFTNLQALLVQLGPKECLLLAKEQETVLTALKEVMERSHVLVSELKSADFLTKDLVQDLNRLLKFEQGEQQQSDVRSEFDLTLAMAGVGAVIKYLELMGDEGNFGQFSLGHFNLEQFMRLDSAAVRALSLLPMDNENLGKNHTLLGLLNKCRTTAGQRLLTQWLKQPLIDINKINERLNIVEALVQNTELRQILYEEKLRKIPDLLKLSKRLQAKKATLQDCFRIYQMVQNLPHLRETLTSYNGLYVSQIDELFITPLSKMEDDFQNFLEMVKTTIDLDQIENGEFLVRSDFDQDLKELHEQMEAVEEKIRSDLAYVSRDLNLDDKVLKLETTSQFGWYYRVTKKGEQVLRSKKSYVTLSTQNKGILFRSPKLKGLNEEYQSYKSSYQEHQKSVVELIMDVARGYCDPLNQLNDVLAQLDALVSFAIVAVTAPKPYIRPKLEEKGSGLIKLKEARHPLVEVQENVDFISNDVTLDHDSSRFQIITGPNMGGKSTYIRSVALNVLLAQIGSFVACDEANISVVDSILTRVGAGDRQLKGVSTFMAEMLETAHILRSSTKNSLVIIDELGRGTSTYDGFGLAWAISEHIVKEIQAFCLFATHFHELTSLAVEYQAVENLHVTALTTSETLTLLYKVKPGICDQSFGIHVAELASFPKDIIDLAKEKVAEFEDFQGVFTSKDGEPNLKKMKTEMADDLIDAFLDKVKEIPVDSLSEEDVISRLEELKLELKQSGNEELMHLLSKIQT